MPKSIILNETSYHDHGAINCLVDEIKKRQLKKALLCVGPTILRLGYTKAVSDLLDKAKLDYEIYSAIKANPTIENVQGGVEAAKKAGADYIIGFGGGSVLDAAKAVGIIITNPKYADVRSLEGLVLTENPSLPFFAIPTTAGTASEVTTYYVITDHENQRKFVCVDPHSVPAVAIIDPDLMTSMPQKLSAATGMDALTHAIESYVSKGAWEMTDMFALEAIRLISANLRDAVANKPSGRRAMALAQYEAGMAFSNAGLGLVHAMAHPLGALYDVAHGIANAILLPTVMAFNANTCSKKFKDIAIAMGVEGASTMSEDVAKIAAIDAVKKLSADIGIPNNLTNDQVTVKAEDVDFLAESAFKDACRPGNPTDVTKEEIAKLYKSLM